MIFFGPLAMLGIQVGTSLLSSYLGKKAAGSQGSKQASEAAAAAAEKTRIETELMKNKQRLLGDLEGFRGAVNRPLDFILRLPGVGGISNEEWSDLLTEMMGKMDFGGNREMGLIKELIGMSQANSNTAGVAASAGQAQQAREGQAAAGYAGIIDKGIGGLVDHFTQPGVPGPGSDFDPLEFAPGGQYNQLDTSFLDAGNFFQPAPAPAPPQLPPNSGGLF